MSNKHFHPSHSVPETTNEIILVKLLLEQLLFSDIKVNIKDDLIRAIEIGIATFYPTLAIHLEERIEPIIDYLIFNNLLGLNEGKEGFWTIPTTFEEKLSYQRINAFEFRKFISFLFKFTKRRAYNELVRNTSTKEESNSLLLDFYAFLSYTYALYLNEIGSSIPIYLSSKAIYNVSCNLFEKAFDLDKEYIVCCNVTELVKTYFVCIKFLVDSYFPE